MPGGKEVIWNARGVGPLTRSVVSAFGGEVAQEVKGLGPQQFADSIMEAFPDISKEDAVRGTVYFGREGAQNLLLNRLHEADSGVVESLVRELEQLAGSSEGVKSLAQLMRDELKAGRISNVKPMLLILSEFAVLKNID